MLGTAAVFSLPCLLTRGGAARQFVVDPRPEVAAVQRALAEAWLITRENFYSPATLKAVDWDGQLQSALAATRTSADAAAARGVLASMLDSVGDPYSRVVLKDAFASFRAQNDGKIEGVGLLLQADPATGRLVVLQPLDNSPASRAGLAPGDEILGIDGRSLPRNISSDDAAARLRGSSGSTVSLRVRHSDSVPGTASRPPFAVVRNVRLSRETIPLPAVSSRALPYVARDGAMRTAGYVRVASFAETSGREVDAALRALRDGGARDGIILDMRGNPGGLVTAGLEVARSFLAPGDMIVSTLDRNGSESLIGLAPLADDAPPQRNLPPVVVLVDGGSASASEIVAGALHDNGRALLLGSRTYGKGRIQSVFPLSDGDALFVTVATYRTPSGADIDRVGIAPDVACAAPAADVPLVEDPCVVEAERRIALQEARSA
jgi:carboxyl-terminal processing protease